MNAGIRKSRQSCRTVVGRQLLPHGRWHFSKSGVRRTFDFECARYRGTMGLMFLRILERIQIEVTTDFCLFQDAV